MGELHECLNVAAPRRGGRGLLALLALVVLLPLPAAAAPGVPKELAAVASYIEPHRAAYDLRLDRSLSSPDIASAVGRLGFESADVCSGWTAPQRSRVLLDRAAGFRADLGGALSAWRAQDGDHYL